MKAIQEMSISREQLNVGSLSFRVGARDPKCSVVFVPLQMAGLQAGRKIYSINEDLVFLRPFAEVETILSQSFCSRRPLRLLVATKAKE